VAGHLCHLNRIERPEGKDRAAFCGRALERSVQFERERRGHRGRTGQTALLRRDIRSGVRPREARKARGREEGLERGDSRGELGVLGRKCGGRERRCKTRIIVAGAGSAKRAEEAARGGTEAEHRARCLKLEVGRCGVEERVRATGAYW
jgi:hypothetical protein